MIKEENINCTIEALILASPEPVSVRRLGETLEDISPARIREAVADLNNIYLGCGSSFRIREVAGGYQFYVLPDFEQVIKKMLVKQRSVRLSKAALEALAIIAYKQPVTKVEIEHIRGVASDGVLHNLLERKLILIAGRSESAGRSLLYKTSNEFLKFFGLNRLSDLPRMDEIEEMIRQADGPKEQTTLEFVQEDGAEDDNGNGHRLSGSGNGDGEGEGFIAHVEFTDDEFDDEESDDFMPSEFTERENDENAFPDLKQPGPITGKTLAPDTIDDDFEDEEEFEDEEQFEDEEEFEAEENLTDEHIIALPPIHPAQRIELPDKHADRFIPENEDMPRDFDEPTGEEIDEETDEETVDEEPAGVTAADESELNEQ